ncbi:growth hormone-regulated TBC protein 1-A-like [Watersipora subatra]|uniref:growth hormone-regulated TBC protein 1-A-like n=1 Tax=Watersipora subatra TaxID=2589382 RepID=UPI00355C2C9C
MTAHPYRQTVDHLGFAIDDEVAWRLYEKSQAEYLKVLYKRSQRWKTFLRIGQDKTDPRKLRRFIRKGIPNEYRCKMWMKLSGAKALMKKNPGLYDSLKGQTADSEVTESIDMDIPRTFPENLHFKDEQGPDSLRPALRRVLVAHAIKHPSIGYCQGLNYIAALMLLVMRNEEKTFWLLQTVTGVMLPDYYVHEPVAMVGLQTDLGVLSNLVKEKSPAVDSLMRAQRADWGLVCTKWFVCLFIDTLPTETVLRVWDAFFNEGRKVLFRVALTLILNGEVTIVATSELTHMIGAFQTASSDIYTWYSHHFMEKVYDDSGEITSQHLNLLTKQNYLKAVSMASK